MNRFLVAFIVLFTLCSTSYGRCQLAIKNAPTLPDAHTASFDDIALARSQVQEFIASSKAFLKCSGGVQQLKANRVRKKVKRLLSQYNKVRTIFTARAQKDPSLLSQPEPMIAAK